MTIVNDDSRVVNKFEASLSDNARVVDYDCHILIVQATGDPKVYILKFDKLKKLTGSEPTSFFSQLIILLLSPSLSFQSVAPLLAILSLHSSRGIYNSDIGCKNARQHAQE